MWVARCSLTSQISELARELDQTPHRNSRRPLRNPWFRVFHPGGTGDVEMYPRRLFGEFFQEGGGGRGTTPSSSGVLKVGNAGTHCVQVLVTEREAPHLLAGFINRSFKPIVEIIVAREDTSIGISQRDYDRSGQSRSVDQMRAAELACVAESVGK